MRETGYYLVRFKTEIDSLGWEYPVWTFFGKPKHISNEQHQKYVKEESRWMVAYWKGEENLFHCLGWDVGIPEDQLEVKNCYIYSEEM